MLYTIFWTLIGIPTGYVTSVIINDINKLLYNKNISKFGKYSIITIIVFFSFLKGYTENDLMTAEYHANNIQAFNTLKHKYKVDIRRYPDSVLEAFFDMSEKVVASVADEGELEKRIYNSYKQYRQYSIDMSPYTEMTFMKARTLKT